MTENQKTPNERTTKAMKNFLLAEKRFIEDKDIEDKDIENTLDIRTKDMYQADSLVGEAFAKDTEEINSFKSDGSDFVRPMKCGEERRFLEIFTGLGESNEF